LIYEIEFIILKKCRNKEKEQAVPSKDDVEKYLNELKQKIRGLNLIILERDKNRKTLAELEIVQSDCKDYIGELTCENYFMGPTADTENEGEFWEFGTMIKGREIYIKINYGKFNKPAICISFHFAEFEIQYPFKK
jgi:hypothetical protein